MVISPILIIIISAILVATLVFYLINKPKIPVFTGLFLFLLLISVFFTFALNVELSSANNSLSLENNFIKSVVTFITMEINPKTQLLQDSFSLFCTIDIVLIVTSVIISVLEMKILFKQTKAEKGN